ncbi:3D domain-containing protein [Pontibacillus salicampi]|uniref:3D domain-containing protein n=1 Tax=Pontibacillus salicampi TaxID=1449801 RepID=A0ABV6LPP2_9BACI
MIRFHRMTIGIIAFIGYIGLFTMHTEALEKNTEMTGPPQEERATSAAEKDVSLKKKTELFQPNNSSSNQQQQNEQNRTIQMEATAYTAHCEGCSGITKTGINLLENPNKKVVAVDPNTIPLGSIVHVEGYGRAIAGDIGSAIQGNRIDVFLNNQADALDFGRRHDVKVTILEEA